MKKGEKLVIEALGDSYYPDLGQAVSAEKMVHLINSDPLISAAPEMLKVLRLQNRLMANLMKKGNVNWGTTCGVDFWLMNEVLLAQAKVLKQLEGIEDTE